MPARRRPAALALPPFERIVDQHGPSVLRFCAARVGADRAEDCFQETMLAALRAYDTVRDPAAVVGWLFTIAARKAIDVHRARAGAPEPVDDLEALAGAHEDVVPDRALWDHVGTLPPKQREAVILRYLGDLSHREIADVMGTSEPAARRNVHEGLRRLTKELTP